MLEYKDKKILAEAKDCNPNDTPTKKKIWDENPQLVLKGNKIINACVCLGIVL